MSGVLRVLALLVAMAIIGSIGVGVYNAGVSAGVAEGLRQAADAGEGGVLVPAYGPYWNGPGFGFFGFLFTLLAIFLVFGLVRAAFGWGRWGGPRGPGGWGPGRREMLAELHRDLHRETGGTGAPTPGSGEERTAGA